MDQFNRSYTTSCCYLHLNSRINPRVGNSKSVYKISSMQISFIRCKKTTPKNNKQIAVAVGAPGR